MMRAKEFKTQGKVYLVGAGPGDPELLTLKAARILGCADVVLHDALVSREVLELVAKNAERIDVGKRCGQKLLTQEEINALLISYAKSNDIVVRLKGGDPLIFGRAGEEMEALRGAGVDFEVVPGITAAKGAAAVARISLTDRRAASQVLITTAHRVREGTETDWSRVTSTTTLVIYMPGADHKHVARQLHESGWPEDMPCAIVSAATAQNQQIRWSNLAALATEPALPAPALLIVGRVAAQVVEEAREGFWEKASARGARNEGLQRRVF